MPNTTPWRAERPPDIGRFTDALFCREPDSVPVAELKVDDTVKAAFLGLPRWPKEQPEAMEAEVRFAVEAGYDFVRAPATVDYYAPGTTHRFAYSANTGDDQERLWRRQGGGVLRSMADVEEYPWPDPAKADLSALHLAAEMAPEGMGIITALKGGGIFERAWFLLGFEGFMMATIEDPELIAETMRRTGEVWCGVVERCVAECPRVSVVWLCDDLAYTEGFMVGPSIYRQHLFPWLERLSALCRRRDPALPLVFHSDGRLWEVLDDLVACGVNALHPIEPKAMDIVELKHRVAGRLCLIGNIDLGYTLTRGTPVEVEAEVVERIRTVGPGGGYCVGSSNSVTDYVPVGNFIAMNRTAHERGAYRS